MLIRSGMYSRPAACPVCGTTQAVCAPHGTPTDLALPPVDVPERKEERTVGPLRLYEDVQVGSARTNLYLSDDDARAMGLAVPEAPNMPAPDDEPVDDTADDPFTEKARTPANKARRPENKA